jgi:sugar lactone lactonase YvrE
MQLFTKLLSFFNHPIRNGILAVALAVVLASCGGGGGVDATVAAPSSYVVSATVTGLPASSNVILLNNGRDALTISANSTITSFATAIASGGAYAVTVQTSPNTYKCTVSNGTGSATSNVTNVAVTCSPITYTVSTLAGTAGVGGTADGTGAAASFYQIRQIATDASGNIYAPDFRSCHFNENRVRKITRAGVVTTLAGGSTSGSSNGTGAAASFQLPTGAVVDSSGNIFIAELGNNLIRKITPLGVVTTFAGGVRGNLDGTGASAKFYAPSALAIDAADNLYVADSYNNNIRKITTAGVVTTLAGSSTSGYADGTGTAASFSFVTGLAVDSNGNVYAADVNNNCIRKITPAGVVSTFAGSTTSGAANGVGSSASFNLPWGVAIDTSGNLIVADGGNNSIRLITPAGIVTTIAGSTTAGSADGVGSNASFNSPWGVAVDTSGNVYVSDQGNFTIRKLVQN